MNDTPMTAQNAGHAAATPLNPADAGFAAQLAAVLPEDTLRQAEPRYLTEPRGQFTGRSALLALPRSVEEVSQLVRHAAAARVGIVPYGGGTGLVGGQVMPDGPTPLIVAFDRMSDIRLVSPEENVLIAEAGCILSQVQEAAAEADRLFPLSLAAEGTARIGGNLSTNAGGVNVLRYGNARALCLGVEAVLPDGQIWNGLTRLYKDNTGYDLKSLLVGAEGSLGLITAAALRMAPRPAQVGTAIFVVPSAVEALQLLGQLQADLGEVISAFELIKGQGLHFLAEVLPQIRQPFADPPEWCVLVELGTARGTDPVQMLTDAFAKAAESGLVEDGLVAQSAAQRDQFWSVREHLPEANRLIGAVSSHDISMPLTAIPGFLAEAPAHVAKVGTFRINCFGHLGDGNLHYNVFPPPGRTAAELKPLAGEVKTVIHDLVARYSGSMSAEHGIGRLKVGDLQRYGDPAKLSAMRAIKSALDPLGIMNPGVILA